MGEVYRARDTKLGRDIALKVLPAELSSDADRLARFEREARTVASLNHPNIVVLHSMEEVGGTRFLTMELIEGQSLDRHVTPGGLPVARVIDLGIALADALKAAHERGVIHRDLKPANVILTREDRVKVLDFGLAKLAQPDTHSELSRATTVAVPISQAGDVVGTVPYMAPEQIRGEVVDARSDLFSLGIVLHELAAGRRPFAGGTLADISSAILRDTPVPLTRLRADVPLDLERIVSRCLEKDAGDRFQSALEVLEALRALRRSLEHRGTGGMTGADVIAAPSLERGPPARASIAVMPFDNLSGDAEQEYFADGIVEEIITGLSRIKWLFVISRNSTFTYKGKSIDVKAVGRDLGVRYLLQGSVRRSGNHVRVTGQLVETETATHVWADRYDGTLVDLFELQDQMTMSVIGAVEPTLRRAEVERVRRTRPNSLDAYDRFLRALPFVTTAMPGDADKALGYLEEAIRLEPTFAAVHGLLAWCHEQRYLRGGLQADSRRSALVHAHAAIATGSDDALALAMGGFVVGILEGNFETAIEAIDRSLALSPSSALAFGFSSIIRAYRGDLSVAIEHARIGIRLGPYDPLIFLPYVGLTLAQFFTGNFVEAVSAATRASAANPRFSVPRYMHAAALARLGRLDEAKAMADVVLELQPGFTISGLASGQLAARERMTMLAEALSDAGLPE